MIVTTNSMWTLCFLPQTDSTFSVLTMINHYFHNKHSKYNVCALKLLLGFNQTTDLNCCEKSSSTLSSSQLSSQTFTSPWSSSAPVQSNITTTINFMHQVALQSSGYGTGLTTRWIWVWLPAACWWVTTIGKSFTPTSLCRLQWSSGSQTVVQLHWFGLDSHWRTANTDWRYTCHWQFQVPPTSPMNASCEE